MRITVYGASGNIGRRVVSEALARGHQVTAVSRRPVPDLDVTTPPDPSATAPLSTVVADVSRPGDVVATSAGQDLVISATRPSAGHEAALGHTTRAILAGLRETNVRLIMVGGAASLRTSDGSTVVEQSDFPRELRPIALACNEQLDACRADSTVDWAYLSPPATVAQGERTGVFRVGGDDLLVDDGGRSWISMEDLAVALLDEAETPRHHRTRFTVGY